MAYASRSGRARVSPTNPQAFGVCDSCGMWYNRCDLRNQVEWRGASLLPLYLYKCNQCYDVPQEQLRAITIPADPIPIIQPRVEPFLADETTYMSLGNGTIDPTTGLPVPNTTTLETVAGGNMTTSAIGAPVGLLPGAIMPQQTVAGVPTEFGAELPVVSVIGTGTNTITVNCSADITQPPYNLATNSQVSVEGLSNAQCNGFFSITLVTNTVFTYLVYGTVNGGLQTPGTVMQTCLVGVPRGFQTIPVMPLGSGEIV